MEEAPVNFARRVDITLSDPAENMSMLSGQVPPLYCTIRGAAFKTLFWLLVSCIYFALAVFFFPFILFWLWLCCICWVSGPKVLRLFTYLLKNIVFGGANENLFFFFFLCILERLYWPRKLDSAKIVLYNIILLFYGGQPCLIHRLLSCLCNVGRSGEEGTSWIPRIRPCSRLACSRRCACHCLLLCSRLRTCVRLFCKRLLLCM